jgi:uncharacterized membrane protein YesL
LGVVFWIALFVALSYQHFFSIMVRLEGNFRKTLKKSFLICFDNLGYSIFMGLWGIVMTALSVFTIGLIPGGAGTLLGRCDAFRLRLYKYDYLEANPEAPRKGIPWDDLLEEDQELVGTRTIKGMLFPWKDTMR